LKDYGEYKPNLMYPAMEDYKTYNIYKDENGEISKVFVGDVESFVKYGNTITNCIVFLSAKLLQSYLEKNKFIVRLTVDEEGYKSARKRYNDEEIRLDQLFKFDLEEEYGTSGHPKADLLYTKAWERGHSSGLSEVAGVYSDLSELLV
jgi:hypothetical protein